MLRASRASRFLFVTTLAFAVSTALACSKREESSKPGPPATAASSAVAVASAAAAPNAFDLSDQLSSTAHTYELPAMAALVLKNGQVLASGVTGVRKLGDSAPATLDDAWSIGACSKAITATIAAMVVDEGKLSWSSTMGELLPDMTIDPALRSVTLDALLQHHAGLERDPPKALLDAALAGKDPSAARRDVVRALVAKPPATAPGPYAYSNVAYLVVGVALERATGKSFEALAKERVFEPLAMRSCGFGSPAARPGGGPSGHAIVDGKLVPTAPAAETRIAPLFAPSGAMHCALGDWAKFLRHHLRVPEGMTPLAKRESLMHLHTPLFDKKTASGFYIEPLEWSAGGALHQFGETGTSFASAWLAPSMGLMFLVATNGYTANTADAVDRTSTALFKRFAK
ncbi:MAG: serine hydrolase domain-containing protein [Polyangiaceae bacterium]